MAHRHELVDYATSLSGARNNAEDIVQEAWLRFSGSRAAQELDHPLGYLYRIVRNLTVDLARRSIGESQETDSEQRLLELASSTPSPEVQACDANQLQIIARACEELPPRTRIAFEMHRLQGHTFAQIGQHLGISVGLAHQLVRDALTYFAKQIDDDM